MKLLPQDRSRITTQRWAVYAVLVLVSAAGLAFQVALTRIFSLAQGHHFAFMAVSLTLLGFGASGAYLSLRPVSAVMLPRLLVAGSLGFALSVPAAYLIINNLPFDTYRIAWEPVQLIWLTLYYLALVVPFFFAGLVVGGALASRPERAGATYGANLLGSGMGPPLALISLAWLGGIGTLFVCTLLGLLAGLICLTLLPGGELKPNTGHRFLRYGVLLLIGITLALTILPPGLFEIKLTPYKTLSQTLLYPGSQVIRREWNAFSRVDVVRSQGIRSAPGLSFAYTGSLPPQLGLTVDGDNLTPISQQPLSDATFSRHLLLSLAFELRPGADVLILEPGGGLAVLAALQNGARSVTVVQSNHTVANIVSRDLADFNQRLYNDPRLSLVINEPRSFLRRTDQTFDLIILPLTDSFRAVTAGAYTLGENYGYTVEAFRDAVAHLSPDGFLIAERWLQLPPSESLRLWAITLEAARAAPGGAGPAERAFALRSLQTSLVGLSPTPLASQDLATIRRFAERLQFDPVWLPGIDPAETNRFSIMPQNEYYETFSTLLNAPDPASFFDRYAFDVAPSSDNHPFFFHFFKWRQTPQIIQSLGRTWQPFGGSGYLVLVLLLALVLVLSAILILLPLGLVSGPARRGLSTGPAVMLRYLLYFILLGLGVLFVEIPLLQQFILYLGQPVYAFAAVVSALLLAAGVGSGWLSKRLPLPGGLLLLMILAISYPLLLARLFEATLSLPLAGRIAITVLALFPIGLLMGVPFPAGLARVEEDAPGLTPWVWAVNGCASVVSAVLASMVALGWGFSAVLWTAGASYGLAALLILRSGSGAQSAPRPNYGE